MVTNPEQALDRLRTQLKNRERDVSDVERDHLLEFDNQMALLKSIYSEQRREKLLRHCTIAAEKVGSLIDALEDRNAAEAIVRWTNREHDDSEETNKDYRIALRMFGKRVTDGSDIPEALEWIPTTTSQASS